ncbi:MAG: hypothetical protein KA282_00070 [Clostridia bacterium]|nr:hypothetical protein [Clostridia bacterium]
MIRCKSKFYRANLKSAEDKAVYDCILAALESQKNEVIISSSLMNGISCTLVDLVLYVRMDNPGLFYVDFQKYSFLNQWPDRKIVFSYLYPITQIDDIEARIVRKIDSIIREGNVSQLTFYEKELALHDYLVENVTYESADKSYHKAHSAVGALLHGRAVCEGYAMAFKLLCDAVGLSCIVLHGTATNSDGKGNHAWNIVKLDGKCYHIDVTWDGCSKTDSQTSRNCFNLTDDDMSQDHTWDRVLLPPCISQDENYFVHSGNYFTSSDELRNFLVKGLKNGQRNFAVRINHKFQDESKLKGIIQDSIKSLFMTNFLGYTYQFQYDNKRNVISIAVKIPCM